MLRVGDNQVPRPVGGQVAQVVQRAGEHLVPIRRMSAPWTLAPLVAAPPSDDPGFRQVLDTRDSFTDISRILARSCHPDDLPEHPFAPVDSSAQHPANQQQFPVTMLQCRFHP